MNIIEITYKELCEHAHCPLAYVGKSWKMEKEGKTAFAFECMDVNDESKVCGIAVVTPSQLESYWEDCQISPDLQSAMGLGFDYAIALEEEQD